MHRPETSTPDLPPDRRNQIDHIANVQKWQSSISGSRILPGVDCNSGHQLLRIEFLMTTTFLKSQINFKPFWIVKKREHPTSNDLWEESKATSQKGRQQREKRQPKN